MAQAKPNLTKYPGTLHKANSKVDDTVNLTSRTKRTPLELPKTGLFRFRQFEHYLPFSRETWRLLVADGRAPQSLKMGQRCTVWRAADIHAWLADPVNYRVPVLK